MLPTYEEYISIQYNKYEQYFFEADMQSVYYAKITEDDIVAFDDTVKKINTAILNKVPRKEIHLLIWKFTHKFFPSSNPKCPKDIANKTLDLLQKAIEEDAQTRVSNNI